MDFLVTIYCVKRFSGHLSSHFDADKTRHFSLVQIEAFADDKVKVTQNILFVFQRVEKKNPFENIVGKGENADNQYFLLSPQCFLPIP